MYINSNQMSSMTFCAIQSFIVLACDSNDSESYQIYFNIQHPLRGLSTDHWNYQLYFFLALKIGCIKYTIPTTELFAFLIFRMYYV